MDLWQWINEKNKLFKDIREYEMSSSTNSNTINPKPCIYNCNTRIFWNTSTNEYWEVFSKKKHVCPNRSKFVTQTTTSTTKPTYYSKKSYYAIQHQLKPKMSNSLELLQGPIQDIQKKYEILSDIITEYNGKTHGSQSHIGPNNSIISLIIYYKVPEGKREEVKRKFNNITRSNNQVI